MGKIIRLTESNLVRLVKRVLAEESVNNNETIHEDESVKKSSLVHLIVTFLDGIDNPKGVCYVATKLNDNGEVILDVNIQKGYFDFEGRLPTRNIRKYYTDKISSYFGVPVHVYFEIGKC
jgi:hypothetical protein